MLRSSPTSRATRQTERNPPETSARDATSPQSCNEKTPVFDVFFQMSTRVICLLCVLESSLHRHGTDGSPAAVQGACGLLDGFTLGVCCAGVTVVKQNLTQVQHRCHTCAVLLDVSLKLLKTDLIVYRVQTQHRCLFSSVCVCVYLLQVEFSLDLLIIAGVIDDGTGEFGFNVSEPGTQVTHVLIKLLYSNQSLAKFLNSNDDKSRFAGDFLSHFIQEHDRSHFKPATFLSMNIIFNLQK